MKAALAVALFQGGAPVAMDDRTGPSALVGCWDMTIDLPIGKKKGKLCFVQQEGKPLSALMFARKKWTVAKSVTARPGHVKVVVNVPVGEAVVTANFDEKKMDGHFTVKAGRRPFQAKKVSD